MLTDAQSKKNLEIPERAINLVEEALYSEEEPRLGGYFFTNLGHALYKTKQRERAQKLFKVCNILRDWSIKNQTGSKFEY